MIIADRPTPITDKAIVAAFEHQRMVPIEFARKLERCLLETQDALTRLHESKAMNAWGHMVVRETLAAIRAELEK